MTLPRHDQADDLVRLLPHQPHGFREVAVIGNDNATVESIAPGIVEKMDCEVDVGTLFLGFDDLDKALATLRGCQWSEHLVGKEVPIYYGKLGDVFLQRPYIGFLAYRLIRIEFSGDLGGKIFDGQDLVRRVEKP